MTCHALTSYVWLSLLSVHSTASRSRAAQAPNFGQYPEQRQIEPTSLIEIEHICSATTNVWAVEGLDAPVDLRQCGPFWSRGGGVGSLAAQGQVGRHLRKSSEVAPRV